MSDVHGGVGGVSGEEMGIEKGHCVNRRLRGHAPRRSARDALAYCSMWCLWCKATHALQKCCIKITTDKRQRDVCLWWVGGWRGEGGGCLRQRKGGDYIGPHRPVPPLSLISTCCVVRQMNPCPVIPHIAPFAFFSSVSCLLEILFPRMCLFAAALGTQRKRLRRRHAGWDFRFTTAGPDITLFFGVALLFIF